MTVAVSTTALPTIFSELVSPGTIGAPTGIDVSRDGRRSGGGPGVHPLRCCTGWEEGLHKKTWP